MRTATEGRLLDGDILRSLGQKWGADVNCRNLVLTELSVTTSTSPNLCNAESSAREVYAIPDVFTSLEE